MTKTLTTTAAALAAAWLALAVLASPANAAIDAAALATAEQRALYADLLDELRCLVCANQSLADSNAALAKDLRAKVRGMVAAGQGRDAIAAYLVDRYGEYVLYRPRFTAANLALWLGPFAVLLAGVLFLLRLQSRRAAPPNYTPQQRQHAQNLLREDSNC